jgi:hypothetical protein
VGPERSDDDEGFKRTIKLLRTLRSEKLKGSRGLGVHQIASGAPQNIFAVILHISVVTQESEAAAK